MTRIRRTARAARVLAVSLLVACSHRQSTMSGSTPDPKDPPSYPVVVDTAPYAKLTPVERKRLDDDAIQHILDLTPPRDRQEMAKYLSRGWMPPGHSGGQVMYWGFGGSSDPEIARWLSVIASIRGLEAAESTRAISARLPRQPDRSGTQVFVTVAIGNPEVTKAVAIMRPDYPIPILLLPPNADEATVKAGLRTVGQAFKDLGPRPAREFRAEIAVTYSDATSRIPARLIAHIREENLRKSIPGVGEGLLAVEVVTYVK